MVLNKNELLSAQFFVQESSDENAVNFAYHSIMNSSYSLESNQNLIYAFNYSENGTNFTTTSQFSNDTIENCDEGFEMPGVNPTLFRIIIYVMYISILLVALLGNGTVCFIVQSSPRMRTVTNFFIANLAVGDILMSFFCVPFSFISMFILQYWPFGAILCRVVNYSQAVSVFVSAYTLVAISVDRYVTFYFIFHLNNKYFFPDILQLCGP